MNADAELMHGRVIEPRRATSAETCFYLIEEGVWRYYDYEKGF
jgi:hypothetical protein